jgi:hypothetical protein
MRTIGNETVTFCNVPSFACLSSLCGTANTTLSITVYFCLFFRIPVYISVFSFVPVYISVFSFVPVYISVFSFVYRCIFLSFSFVPVYISVFSFVPVYIFVFSFLPDGIFHLRGTRTGASHLFVRLRHRRGRRHLGLRGRVCCFCCVRSRQR